MPSFANILFALGAASSVLAGPIHYYNVTVPATPSTTTTATTTTTVNIVDAATATATVSAVPAAVEARSDHTGDLTYYMPGLGACGETNSDSDLVVALSQADYPGNCGKTITITKGGKTATAKVVDKCMGCEAGSIDVSSTVFKSIADMSVGRTSVSWTFN